MENQTEGSLNPQDDLRASNELLKLKLELDHKMTMSNSDGLPPEIENQWLNQVYNFEKSFKEAGRAKVYDLIGRPDFMKFDTIPGDQLKQELSRILNLLEEKSIVLDCCVEYDDAIIYRFLTEELFQHETDAFFVEGMTHHFIYEEFHPNHDYDLRRLSIDFIEDILNEKWREEFDHFKLADLVFFYGRERTRHEISSIILAFQEGHAHLNTEKIKIKNVIVDLERKSGIVHLDLAYSAWMTAQKVNLVQGKSTIYFFYESEFGIWSINGFELPGFDPACHQ